MEPFKYGDIIEFCDEWYLVLNNYGTTGRVQEYYKGGNVGDIIDPFYWQFGDAKCVLVKGKGEMNEHSEH